MTDAMKLVATLVVLFSPSLILSRMESSPGITRGQYALLTALSMSLRLFLLTLMYVDQYRWTVGLLLLVVTTPGAFAWAYFFFYPRFRERMEARTAQKQGN